MPTRTFAVATAVVGAAALATTGITYASTAGSQSAPSHQQAAAPVRHAAPPVRQAAPAAAPVSGGDSNGKRDEGRNDRDRDDRERGGHGYERRDEGRIEFNERTFSAATDGCIVAASGLGSSSFSIFNDSRKIVEVFRGFTCDNGAPVATVGPFGATNGVVTRTVEGGLFGDDGVVGSFRVIGHHDEW
ncbi:hypothetical protein AAW14_04310 [Streptomyces hygroscopicus]|uniref:hypothetical protein n=1 Tax=Streptomyces hygroscopicus TaxID=1912 RepID=UPI00223FBED1|nr:hypothetical protein [Streptomyces hygroscopicus]MCW7941294.1 hypothetical protein [Streptomyces hygroscopicus]